MNQPVARSRFPHLLIRASAGTGKTFQLSNRFLGLLRAGVGCDPILATTFTRKAAGEILDRVILRLSEAAENPKKRKELQKFTGDGPFDRDQCLTLLEQLMRQMHRMRVSTLDSYFSQMARSFSLELGLPPGWTIIDDIDDARLRRDAIHTVLSTGDTGELRTLIQLLTKGEATRGISRLIHDAVNDLYQLFLATDEEAWNKIPRSKPLDDVELAATIEDLRAVELPDKRMNTTRESDWENALAGAWDVFLSKGLTKKVAEGSLVFYKKPIPEPAVAIYERLIDHVRAELVGRVASQTEASHRLLARFHTEYARLKHAHRAMRFEDVTRQLADLREVAETSRVAFRMDSRIDHLLLDEFQDTSPQQWQVIQPLAERVTSAATETSFFCVGDIKQAIYGWRGGVAEIFDAIDRQLSGLQSETLNASYRSSTAVIETVNQIFQNLPRHERLGDAEVAVRAWCDRFETHQTQRKELAGFAELCTAPEAGDDEDQRDVTLGFAADKIAEFVQEAPGFSVGVLVRKNATVGKLIYELRRRDVLASEEGGNPLTDSASVLVVLSALRLADHPADTVARFHLCHSPLSDTLGISDYRDSDVADAIAEQIRSQLVRDGYGPTVQAWATHLAEHCNQRELNRLEQLIELAYTYDSHTTLRPSDFVVFIEATRVADPVPADVRVMTIHQSKGLEFDVVVLPEFDSDIVGQADTFVIYRPDPMGRVQRVCRYASREIRDLMPASIQQMFSEATNRSVTESMCVLYVALTRATHALHMIIPPSKANERSIPRNFAALLRAALKDNSPVPAETVLFEYGDRQWYQDPGEKRPDMTEAQQAHAAGEQPPVEVKLALPTGAGSRGWERTSPSGLEGGSQVMASAILTPKAKAAAFLYGQLIHAWFEQIEWLDDGEPDDAMLRAVAEKVRADAGSPPLNVDETLLAFRADLQRPAIAKLLRRARYTDGGQLDFPDAVREMLSKAPISPIVRNEPGFAYQQDGQLINGFIDRLVLLYQGEHLVAAEVLDYKTDSLDSKDLTKQIAAKIEFYTPQLQAYQTAVSRLTGLSADRIAARLVILNADQVCTIPW